MIDRQAIKHDADLVVNSCRKLVDFPFGYDEKSVAWVEGYIERLRARGMFDSPTSVEKLSGTFGCFLGEAIVACHGGLSEHHRTGDRAMIWKGAKTRSQTRSPLAAGIWPTAYVRARHDSGD